MFWFKELLKIKGIIIFTAVIIFLAVLFLMDKNYSGPAGIFFLIMGVSGVYFVIVEIHNIYCDKEEEELRLVQEEESHNKYMQGINTLQDAYNLSPTEFEILIKHLFEKYGYEVELTSATGDGGVDLYLYKDSKTEIVQCKRYNSSISVQPVREFFGVMVDQQITKGYIVTTSNFTLPAQKFAQGKCIDLIDGETLAEMLLE